MISDDECVEVGSCIRRRLEFDNDIDLNFSAQEETYDEMVGPVNFSERVNLVHSKIRKEQVPVTTPNCLGWTLPDRELDSSSNVLAFEIIN